MLKLRILSAIFTIAIVSCAGENVPLSHHKTSVMTLHHSQRDHHFNKDSIAFANQMSDNFVSVNGGYISKPSHEENIARYHGYFSAVEFEQWDDVSEPTLRFSADSSMAYTVVDKVVELSYPDTLGNLLRDTTHFAWTTIYKLYGDEWKIDCVTSTHRK